MWTRIQLKTNAKENFRRFYWMAVLAILVLSVLGGEMTFDFNYSDVRDMVHNVRSGD